MTTGPGVARRTVAHLLLMTLTVLAFGWATPAAPARADTRPATVPALREWTARSGSFTYTSSSRILLDPAHSWGTTGQTVADDLQALTRVRPAVVSGGSATARTGDIFLTLGSTDSAVGTEGYLLDVGAVLRVSARTQTGAFYGTRSVLQLLRQSWTIPAGVARDWPSRPQRGIWLDTTSRYFDPAWFRNLVRDMSYLKLNELGVQLYFVDRAMSDSDVAQLVEIAGRYHVNVTPQRQVAGHADLDILKGNPSYAVAPGGSGPPRNAFDFTKSGALAIAQRAIEETIVKFPGRYFHAGGDEFLAFPFDPIPWSRYPQFASFARDKTGNPNATGGDALDWYLNWINGIVKSYGKTLVVWNDQLEPGGVLRLDPDIQVDHWVQPWGGTTMLTPQQLVDAGHKTASLHMNYLYYDKGQRHPDARRVYDAFDPTMFHSASGDHQRVTGTAAGNVVGARIAVWTWSAANTPEESNHEIAGRLYGPMRALAQVNWGTAKLHPDFAGFDHLVHRLGRAPGYLVAPATYGTGSGVGLGFEMNGELTYAHRTGNGSVRHGWQTVPGSGPWAVETFPTGVLFDIAEDPVLARYPSGVKTLLARRFDGTLVQATQYVGNSGPWAYRTIGATAAGRPKALVDSRGQLTLAARQSNGTILLGREAAEHGGWTFSTLGSGVAGNPDLALDAAGRIVIAARNTAGTLLLLRQQSPDSTGFTSTTIGQATIAGTPALARNRHGELTYFVRTSTGAVQYGRQSSTGAWLYQNVGPGGVGSDPAVALDVNGRLVYLARTTAGHLQHGWETTPGSRTTFSIENLGSGLTGEVAVGSDVSGRLTYYVTETTGRLRHGFQKAPGSGPWGTCRLEVDC